MAMAVCVVGYTYGQYVNQLNITSDKSEYTYLYNWDRPNLVSVSAVLDSLWNNYGYNAYEFKEYDANFNVINQKRYVDTNRIYAFGRSMTYHQGAYYAGGFKDSAYYLNDTTDGFLIKFDSIGNKIWEKRYHGYVEKVDVKFILPQDTLLILCLGDYNPTSGVNPNAIWTSLIAIDTSGSIIWERNFTGYNEYPVNLKKTGDGGFILTTYTQVTSNYDTRVYKLDNLGNTQWVRTLGDGSALFIVAAHETPSNNYICLGTKTISGVQTSWLVKLDANGTILHDTVYDFAPSPGYKDYFNGEVDVIFKSNGFYAVGYYKSMPSVLAQTYLAFVNYDLELQWVRFFGKRTYNDLINYICPYKPNPEFLFMGGVSFSDDSTNTNDEWFIVVDSLGCDVQGCSVGIAEPSAPNHILSVAPNPTSGKVRFQLQQEVDLGSSTYEIVITDMQGKLIKILPLNNVSVSYEFLQQQHGVYLIHLVKNKQRVQTQKLILVE